MNATRHKSLVDGLPGSARKVYSVLPIQAYASRPQIFDELRKMNVSMSRHEVDRCLHMLIEVGLVTQPNVGQYRRVFKGRQDVDAAEMPEKSELAKAVEDMELVNESRQLVPAAEAVTPAVNEAAVKKSTKKQTTGNAEVMNNVTPIHKEGAAQMSDTDLATAIMGVSIRLADTVSIMKQLAEEIEGLAVEVESRLKQSGEAAEKLKALRGLLQSVAA